jgi:hypothetical protein
MASMTYRKLRIAWSVLCGMLCLLLVVLWVRSYLYHDIVALSWNSKQGIRIDAVSGGATFMYIDWRSRGNLKAWSVVSLSLDKFQFFPISGDDEVIAGLLFQRLTDGYVVILPFWFFTPMTGIAAAIPWLWRFSLRTLLIGMTLIAILLGIAVAM